MKYKKAQDILPDDILKVIQEYIDGEYLYIPRKEGNKKSWGENSKSYKELTKRNEEIFKCYKEGKTVSELCEMYFLSENSIKRIIRLYKKTG